MAFARNIALSVAPPIQQAAANIRERCEAAGFIVEEFASGELLEAAIREDRFDAVIDVTLVDLVDAPSGAERLTAAAMLGVPQLLVPGALDQSSPRVLDRVSKEVALKASASRGPTIILIPESGWSDQLALDPEKLRVLVAGLRLWLSPQVMLRMIPDAVGDAAFAMCVAEVLAELISSRESK